VNQIKVRHMCLEAAARMSSDPSTAIRYASVFEHFVVCGYLAASESLDVLIGIMAAAAPQPSPPADEMSEKTEGEEPLPAEASDTHGLVH
jgi:hypothetical protein